MVCVKSDCVEMCRVKSDCVEMCRVKSDYVEMCGDVQQVGTLN